MLRRLPLFLALTSLACGRIAGQAEKKDLWIPGSVTSITRALRAASSRQMVRR